MGKHNAVSASVSRILSEVKTSDIKEKEPTAAATATDSKEKTLQVQDSTNTSESQALRGTDVLWGLRTMLASVYGKDAETIKLSANVSNANILFRYKGMNYALQFMAMGGVEI